MNRIASFCLLAVMISQASSLTGKPKAREDKRVEAAASRPDLAVQFDRVAQLKIVSRKSTFHVGEMITLDIAVLNTSTKPLYFHDISDLKIEAKNQAGDRVIVQSYGVADRVIVPGSFNRVAHNEFLLRSFQLLVRCDRRAFDQMQSSGKDTLVTFNDNSFVSWGDACVQIAQPGTYIIAVEIKNDRVLSAPRLGKTRTAVGRIKSNPLEISVVD